LDKIKKYKDVVFTPIEKNIENLMEPPIPAKKNNIPDWHKEASKYSNGAKSISYTEYGNNLTVKSCMPLIDSFTSGYLFLTPFDIEIVREDSKILLKWSNEIKDITPPVAFRPKEIDSSNFPKIFGYDELSFSWTTYWNLKTPPGYSCIFTHPLNRADLPFYSFSGIIDTDKWNLAGLHPFIIKENWEGIIPKGTPYIQAIPFKRDDFKSKQKKYSIKDKKLNFERISVIGNFYKYNLWSKKDYR
jgi:hypothetical protein